MDIQIQYLNALVTYANITNFDELVQEIQQKYPILSDLEFSYQDEEGDQIQVSNTSDLLAITDFNKVVIKMDAKVDEEKQKELEKIKKVQELKQRKLEEARQKKMENLTKEQQQIKELEAEYQAIQEAFRSELILLEHQLDQYTNYKPDPLPDFKEALGQSNLFDQIREKEASLLLLDEKKGFDTQLKTIQKEIHELFHTLYSQRLAVHQENYKKWKDSKQQQAKLESAIEGKKAESEKQSVKLNEKIQKHTEKLAQLKIELEQSEQQY